MIIDIGSGHKPHPKANILLEYAYSNNEHRWNKNIVADRPLVLYKGEVFPFMNKSFIFSICKHVLEHVKRPDLFLNEISRISHEGYIETPNEISELIFTPYDKHLWVIGVEDEYLIIRKKIKSNNSKLGKLFDFLIENEVGFENFFYKTRRRLFLVEYSWREKIKYRIAPSQKNPITNFYDDGILSLITTKNQYPYSIDDLIPKLNGAAPALTPQTMAELLMCPYCKSSVKYIKKSYFCSNCNKHYSQQENIIRMY